MKYFNIYLVNVRSRKLFVNVRGLFGGNTNIIIVVIEVEMKVQQHFTNGR